MDGIIALSVARKYTDKVAQKLAGGLRYKGSKPSAADLPLSGNELGHMYTTNDTGHEWVWTKDASSGSASDWLDLSKDLDNKLNVLGKEPISGSPYNLPYYFYTVPGTDKVEVHAKTLTLDNMKTEGDYSLDVPAATTDNAGLMSSADKVKLNKSLDVLPLVDEGPGKGWPYHIPYDFEATPDTEKLNITLKTLTLDNKCTKMNFEKSLPAATTTTAGLMSASDKVSLEGKQDKLTAGTNVQINDNVISATDTVYSAGKNITIDANNVISATDTSATEYIELTGWDESAGWHDGGTLTEAQATVLTSNELNYIWMNGMHRLDFRYKDDNYNLATYSANDGTKTHVIEVTLSTRAWRYAHTVLQAQLTAGTNINIDSSNVISAPGVATESWVEGKGYLTQHQDISGKLNVLPLVDEGPGKGWPYHIPYDFEVTPQADQFDVTLKTLTLDNKVTKMNFAKQLPSATTSTAGLMSAGDKVALAGKQDKLTSGKNITITDNTISANAEFISVTGTSGTLTDEQVAVISDNTDAYISLDGRPFRFSTVTNGRTITATYVSSTGLNSDVILVDVFGKTWNYHSNELQSKISDLETIRSGAALGATAIQQHQDISGKANDSEVVKLTGNQSIDGSKEFKQSIHFESGTASTLYGFEGITQGNIIGSTKYTFPVVPNKELAIVAYTDYVDSGLVNKQDTIEDLQTIRDGAALGATSIQQHQDISGKQDKLTAGTNITIDANNVISATGGSAPDEYLSSASVDSNNNLTIQNKNGTDVVNCTVNYELTNDKVKAVLSDSEKEALLSGITGTTWVSANANITANTNALGGLKLKALTQAEYDALTTKDANTLYIIK